jgi:hypothetical protein
MKLYIFILFFLFSCGSVVSNETSFSLNDFKLIRSLTDSSSISRKQVYLHIIQSSCSVCYADLFEWERKFSDCEYKRDEHIFLLIGGDIDIVKYNINENVNIYSNIYYGDKQSIDHSLFGSHKAIRDIDKLILIKKINKNFL